MTQPPRGSEADAAAPPLAEAVLADGRAVLLRQAGPQDVDAVLDVIHAAFGAREQVGARPDALNETPETIGRAVAAGTGFLAVVDGRPAGAILVAEQGDGVRLGRVSVHPALQRAGIAHFMTAGLLEVLAARGAARASVLARREYPHLRRYWESHGFAATGEEGDCYVLERALPLVARVPDADAMRALGRALAPHLSAGDLIIASGDLGAGKTTFTQGLGEGLGVEGPVISPTFVLARVHPSTVGGPALVHADAYRLGGFAELEDLDLEASLDDAVTLVEWGAGVAEPLTQDRIDLDIRRGLDPADETRWVFVTPYGDRHRRDELAAAVASAAPRAEEQQ